MIHPPIVYAGENAPSPTPARECWLPDQFACPVCGQTLTCSEDYGSGSNHYWTLRCMTHGRFTAGTYRYADFDGYTPRAWPE
jgi:hypothetical protein